MADVSSPNAKLEVMEQIKWISSTAMPYESLLNGF